MPIFTQSLRKVDIANPTEAIKEMANHIRYIQEQLEYTLMNLDSGNIVSIDTDDTQLSGSSIEDIARLTQTVNGLASTVSVQGSNIVNLQNAATSLSESVQNLEASKLTASKVAAQAGVAGSADAATVAAALNSLISAMKNSGVMST